MSQIETNPFRYLIYHNVSLSDHVKVEKVLSKADKCSTAHLSDKARKTRQKHSRAYDPWSPEEDALLLHLIKKTNACSILCHLLGRSERSLKERYFFLKAKKTYPKTISFVGGFVTEIWNLLKLAS